MRHSIEAVRDYRLFRIATILQHFTLRFAQIVFEPHRASIQLQVNRSRDTDSNACPTKVFGCLGIRSAPEQERSDLFQRRQGIARCNHTDIEHSIIEIGARRHLHNIGVAARIADDHLQGLAFPDHLVLMFPAADVHL